MLHPCPEPRCTPAQPLHPCSVPYCGLVWRPRTAPHTGPPPLTCQRLPCTAPCASSHCHRPSAPRPPPAAPLRAPDRSNRSPTLYPFKAPHCALAQPLEVLSYSLTRRANAPTPSRAVPLHGSATPWRSPAPRPCTALHSLPLPLAPRATGSSLEYSPPFPASARSQGAVGLPERPPGTQHPPPPCYGPSNRPPRPATPRSCSVPRLAPRDGPLSLRVHLALRESRTSSRRSPPRRSHMLYPDTAPRTAPAQHSTEPPLSQARQPYNIRPTQSPIAPRTSPPRSPARPRTVPLRLPA